jgi:hypothetical protein
LALAARSTDLLPAEGGNRRGGNGIAINVEILRYQHRYDDNPEVVSEPRKTLELKPGEWIGWRVTNKSPVPIELTLLFVDSQAGIDAIYPRSGTSDAVPPGGSFSTRPGTINDKTIGYEHLVVIAVESTGGQPHDFTFLEQETLSSARLSLSSARGPRGEDVLNTPLGQLLQTAMYGEGKTRGFNEPALRAHQLKLVRWKVVKSLPRVADDP